MQKIQTTNPPDFSTLSGRESIFLNLINQNPGIRYLELKSLTGFNNGVVSHYLHQLESQSLIKSVRTPRVSCFYPLCSSELSQKIFRRLRQVTPQKIILALIQKNHSFRSLVKEVKKAPSTVSTYTTKLIHDGIVVTAYVDSEKIFKINCNIYDQLIYTLKTNT
jgi:predicted transcriptional regulator